MAKLIMLLYALFINVVQAYIFRLPRLRHANFTKFAVDHYFFGTIISTFESFEKKECGLSCVSHDTCAFFNYAYQNRKCELFDNAEGDVIQQNGTDIFYAKSIPMESLNENDCEEDEVKFLDCSNTGYTCKLVKNKAQNKTASASSFYSNNYLPNYITDGRWIPMVSVCWHSSASHAAHWIMIDVGVSVDVIFLEIMNAPKLTCFEGCDNRLYDFNVTIGNDKEPTTKNALCIFNVNQNGIRRKKYNCLGGVTSGRYITAKQNKVAAARVFQVCELRVYVVDKE